MATENYIEGLEALNKRLAYLGDDMKYKGGRAALRKATNIIRDSAQASAERFDDWRTPDQVVALNVATRWSMRRFRRTGDLMFRIGVLGGARDYSAYGEIQRTRGKSNPGGDTFYWRFLEFGAEQMNTTHEFMLPALTRNIAKATNEFIRQYDLNLTKLMAKAGDF